MGGGRVARGGRPHAKHSRADQRRRVRDATGKGRGVAPAGGVAALDGTAPVPARGPPLPGDPPPAARLGGRGAAPAGPLSRRRRLSSGGGSPARVLRAASTSLRAGPRIRERCRFSATARG